MRPGEPDREIHRRRAGRERGLPCRSGSHGSRSGSRGRRRGDRCTGPRGSRPTTRGAAAGRHDSVLAVQKRGRGNSKQRPCGLPVNMVSQNSSKAQIPVSGCLQPAVSAGRAWTRVSVSGRRAAKPLWSRVDRCGEQRDVSETATPKKEETRVSSSCLMATGSVLHRPPAGPSGSERSRCHSLLAASGRGRP